MISLPRHRQRLVKLQCTQLQIQVKNIDQEKIVFFTPDGGKNQIVMMSFRPKNSPNFYTAMMKNPETYEIYYLIKTSPRSI